MFLHGDPVDFTVAGRPRAPVKIGEENKRRATIEFPPYGVRLAYILYGCSGDCVNTIVVENDFFFSLTRRDTMESPAVGVDENGATTTAVVYVPAHSTTSKTSS